MRRTAVRVTLQKQEEQEVNIPVRDVWYKWTKESSTGLEIEKTD